MDMAELDVDLLRHALTLARQNGYSEVELEVEGGSFSAVLTPERRIKARVSSPDLTEPESVATRQPIKSKVVGYYKESKTPLAVGARVEVGQVVGLVAALGIANDIESRVSGTVEEVVVSAGQAVEFGQVIAWVEEK